MEKSSFVSNGGIKMPIGYRFCPTDEELLVHYLWRKVFSFPLPASIIPEADVYHTNPWDLPGDLGEKRYFFWKRKRNVNKWNGIAKSGYWKAIGKEKYIVANQTALGVKRTQVFRQGNRPSGTRTHWVMHEFCLLSNLYHTPNISQELVMEMEDWVVCCIYQKKGKSKNSRENKKQLLNAKRSWSLEEARVTTSMDMLEEEGDLCPPQPSSSSSEIGVVFSSKAFEQEETSRLHN